MRLFGATLDLIPSKAGLITARLIDNMIAAARDLSKTPNTFWTDQVNNVDNRNAYHQMAREIISVMGSGIDEFIQGVGTSGSISGNAEVFKAEIPSIKITAIEPYNVPFLSGGDISGTHRLEGIGLGFIPSIYRGDLIDHIIKVRDRDAYETARQLALREGILGGITSGANVWAAIERARIIGPGKKIVTIIVDSGMKYLQGDLFR
jgi:cysteine synthase A